MLMCEKCEELDDKIEHYRNLRARVTDRQTNEGESQSSLKTCRLKKPRYTLSAKLISATGNRICATRPFAGRR